MLSIVGLKHPTSAYFWYAYRPTSMPKYAALTPPPAYGASIINCVPFDWLVQHFCQQYCICHQSRDGGHVVKMAVGWFSVLLFCSAFISSNQCACSAVHSAPRLLRAGRSALQSIIISICHSSATISGRHCSPGMPRARPRWRPDRLINARAAVASAIDTNDDPSARTTSSWRHRHRPVTWHAVMSRLIKVSTERWVPSSRMFHLKAP